MLVVLVGTSHVEIRALLSTLNLNASVTVRTWWCEKLDIKVKMKKKNYLLYILIFLPSYRSKWKAIWLLILSWKASQRLKTTGGQVSRRKWQPHDVKVQSKMVESGKFRRQFTFPLASFSSAVTSTLYHLMQHLKQMHNILFRFSCYAFKIGWINTTGDMCYHHVSSLFLLHFTYSQVD